MDSSSTEKHDLPPQPNRSTPPPSYGLNDDKLPDITAAFSNLDLSPSTKPTPDQCIAHLKLLEAIHQLREDTALTNGLWGLEDDFAAAGKTEKDRAELLTKIREKRWQIYVSEAARRFERWWFTSIEPEDVSSRCLKQSQVVSEFQRILRPGPGLIFDRTNLPPLGERRIDRAGHNKQPRADLPLQMSSWSGMHTNSTQETSLKTASDRGSRNSGDRDYLGPPSTPASTTILSNMTQMKRLDSCSVPPQAMRGIPLTIQLMSLYSVSSADKGF